MAETKYVIELNVQRPARRLGIKNGKNLADKTGLAFDTAYSLWNETATRIDLQTLATLCSALNCQPSTILKRKDKP